MANTDVEFTTGCTFTRDDDGTISIAWDNGHAVTAVRGAAIDYVDPMFHMAVTRAGNDLTYAPEQDLKRLLDGNIPGVMALVIVGIRKVCSSFEGAQLNIAEVATVNDSDASGSVTEADWKRVTGNVGAFRALLDIGPTILGMNGLSLMLKGHNYIEADSMWSRLEAAADLETLVTPLGLMDYSGRLFHDALHPFVAEWKVALAADVASPLVGHVNGVLVKRLPGVPAGTTILSVTLAAIKEIKLIRPAVAKSVAKLEASLKALQARVRAAPLDWCAVFQRGVTAQNLAEVSKLEPLCAFIYGACTALFDRKMSIMKSASFKNNASRHTAMTAVGNEWAESLVATKMTPDAIAKIFNALIRSAGDETEDDDEEEDEEEE